MKFLKRFLPVLCATLLLLGTSFTVFASSFEYPAEYDKYEYWIISYDEYSTGNYRFYTSLYPMSVMTDENGNDCLVINNVETNNLYIICYDTTGKRSFVGANSSSGPYLRGYIYASSHDVYASDGTLFFQRPLPMIQQAIQTAQLTEVVTNQTLTIATIAVFCLALVIGSLVLLPKLKHFL